MYKQYYYLECYCIIINSFMIIWLENVSMTNTHTCTINEWMLIWIAYCILICPWTGEGQTCRIDPVSLKLRCPVLQRYIDNKRPLELQALYAVQALNHSLQNPPGKFRSKTTMNIQYTVETRYKEIWYNNYFLWSQWTDLLCFVLFIDYWYNKISDITNKTAQPQGSCIPIFHCTSLLTC